MTKKCNICGKSADAPYRRIAGGKITEGCVAKVHDKHIHGESKNWAAKAKFKREKG